MRNLRFADFVQPGRVLTVTVEIHKFEDRDVELKARGSVDGRAAVNGRLVLERYNLADTRPILADTDAYLKQRFRTQLALLYHPPEEFAAQGNSQSTARDGRQGKV